MGMMQRVYEEFVDLFNSRPFMFRSPGRINLMGELGDINPGHVLSAAIEQSIWLALAPRQGKRCRIYALNLHQHFEFDLDALVLAERDWPNYIMGVVDQFMKSQTPPGAFDCVLGGDLPLGAGLASSSALTSGLAFALEKVYNLGTTPLELAKLAQRAELDFVGVQCGIMDPYVNLFANSGHLLLIDCPAVSHVLCPFDFPSLSLVLFNSNISHSLAASEYNKRQKECHYALETIRKRSNTVTRLRDLTLDLLEVSRPDLEPLLYRRCRFVVEERERVFQAVGAIERGDLPSLGNKMIQSHRGLRDEYHVSCPELDFLVDEVSKRPGVYGARMMGVGSGGCTLNLIDRSVADEVRVCVDLAYRSQFGVSATPMVTSIGAATASVEVTE